MSQEIFIRGLFSAFISLAFAWAIFSQHDSEAPDGTIETSRLKYPPYVPGNLLPLFLLTMTLLGLHSYGVSGTARMIFSLCFSIFLQISIYYLILMPLLPLLRRWISARACAVLWLVPNYLHFLSQSYMVLPSPWLVITVNPRVVQGILTVWGVGFLAVLLWKSVGHLRFRRRILKNAAAVTDPEVLAVFHALLEEARFRKPRFRLMTALNTPSPLTIGLFKRTTVILLPSKPYSQSELELILRHEIIHISREDVWNKFFMVFCSAMCWFNPLMWLAMKRSADDFELSCDETVLLEKDDADRKEYARLLLDTCADQRGFTTCLSSSAEALRYRLRSITKPRKRFSGALLIGAVFFLLSMTSGYVSLTYDTDTGANLIYRGNSTQNYAFRHINLTDDNFNREFEVRDEAALHDYLSGLTLYTLTGNYSYSDSQHSYTYLMDTPDGTLGLLLFDDAIKLVPLFDRDSDGAVYHVAGGIDWDYMDQMVLEYPAAELRLTTGSDTYRSRLTPVIKRLWRVENGERQLLLEMDPAELEYHGLFTRAPFPSSATLSFNHCLEGACSVLIESWDYSSQETHCPAPTKEGYWMELPNEPAHYTIFAALRDRNGSLYEVEFWFNIGEVASS